MFPKSTIIDNNNNNYELIDHNNCEYDYGSRKVLFAAGRPRWGRVYTVFLNRIC